MKNTYIKYNGQTEVLNASTLEDAMKFNLAQKLDKLKNKLRRAKTPQTKLIYRSQVAEVNYKLMNL